ncbi:MAG: SusC/RagA family TonB-linked outer membrane protein [Balneolaceae bacterium]
MISYLHVFLKALTLTVVLLLSWHMNTLAQSTVSGQVTDAESGESLPGVNVVLQGTTTGATTNVDGQYELDVPSLQGTLVFSYIGFQQQVVPIRGRTTIDVELSPVVIFGEELVVVGYGTSRREDVTTSISRIDPSNIPVAAKSNINDMLFGQAAGLKVTQESSQPGGNVDLSIRGRGAPLIIVDGVVVPSSGLEPSINFSEINNVRRGSLAGLNPSDIESIEVLKDASASMYGVDASSGVILITTKRGRSDRMDVSYSSSVSYQQNMDYMQPLTAEQYMRYFNQFEADRYNAENSMGAFGPNPTDYTSRFSQSEISSAGVGTNWVDHVLKDGNLTNQNLSISGGAERITYYFSGNFFNQNGTVENSGLQKYNARASLTFRFNDVISFNASLTGNKNFYNNTVAGWQTGGAGANSYTALQAAFAYPAYLSVRDEDGNFTQFQITGNPVAQLQMRDKTKYNSVLANFSVDLTLIPETLTGKILYGNNFETSERDFFIPSTVNWFDEYASRGSLQQDERQYQTIESYLNFRSAITEYLDVTAVAGFGQYINESFSFGLQARGMLDAVNTNRVNGAASNVNSRRTKNIKRSYFTRASFDILDRYILEGSLRYDGYSQFFPDSKYNLFPSASAAWKVSNESFFETVSAVSMLKLRASIGLTGSVLPTGSAYAAYEPEGFLASFDNGSTSYIPVVATQLDHPDLTWEKTIIKNAGIDFGLFNDRVFGSFDIFRDDVTDLLNSGANTPALSLLPRQPVNGGHQVRTGYEFDLSVDVIRRQDLFWRTGVTFTHFKHRWEDRFEETDLGNHQSVTDPVGVIYAFETDGILSVGQEIPAWQPEAAMVPGSPIFVDQNGDGVLDANDVKQYSQLPTASIGVINTFNYKNFDLSILLYGQFGAYRVNNSLQWANPNGMLGGNLSGTQDMKHVWSTENQDGWLPGAAYRGNIGALGEGDMAVSGVGTDSYVSSTDFLRARNITLGYTFDGTMLNNLVRDLRVYLDVQNAFTITNYEGADPEVRQDGVRGAPTPFPMVRTVSFGVNINF